MRAYCYYSKWLFTLGLVCLCILPGFAQNYGLGFASHEVIADKRTSLDLFPEDGFSARQTFELSFEMSFLPNKADYFGYICRIISNNHNIDLVYNNRLPMKEQPSHNRFKLVVGEHYAVDFTIPPDQLYHNWNKVSLRFDLATQILSLNVNGKKVGQQKTDFIAAGLYKIVFGICNKPEGFKTSDCSAIKLRNVAIVQGGTLQFFWPLDEAGDNIAHDEISDQAAWVLNPHWMKADHEKWQLQNSIHIDGIATVTFDANHQKLFVVGANAVHEVSVTDYSDKTIPYTQPFNLLPSNESLFVPFKGKLYNYYIDNSHQQLAEFDTAARRWRTGTAISPLIDYWQTNSFACATDTSIYVVNGYGRMTYKNEVFRCNLNNGKWEKITVKGDRLCPRYLSACGTTVQGNVAYFLGGYGSSTGEQMLDAKNLYDLFRFDVKSRTFKKLFELKTPTEGFVCSNTMLIDEERKTYTVLVYANQKFNTSFRLLTGSLTRPDYQLLGEPVPFNFYDTHSFLKLFYNRKDKQYIAVTVYRPTDHDHDSYIQVYSLLSPAENISAPTAAASMSKIILFSVLGLIPFTVIGYLLYNRKRKVKKASLAPQEPVREAPGVIIPVPVLADEYSTGHSKSGPAIYLFGNMKINDIDGKDITGNFTSLVKELFLVIMIYSLRSKSGISPDKLIELLWPDKSEESARNNRSANLSRLKAQLNHLGDARLSKDTGNWRTEIDYTKVYVDFYTFLKILENKKRITRPQVAELCMITSRGGFLSGTDYHWLDQIKSNIANDAIDIYLGYIENMKVEEEPDFAIEIADAIFAFDAVNEEAMMVKCRALSILGKHSLAKSTYENFSKEFKYLYGEQFKSDFHAIISAC